MENNTIQTDDFNKFYFKHMPCLILSLIIAAAAVVIQTVFIIKYYDTEIFLYSAGSVFPVIFNVGLFICAVLLFSSVIINRKLPFPDSLPPIRSASVFCASLCGFSFFTAFILSVYDMISKNSTVSDAGMPASFAFIAAVCAVPSAVYFFIIAIKRDPYKNMTAVFGFGVVVWAAAKLMGEYFNMTNPLNNPLRILHQLSYSAVMLFYLYDAAYSAKIKKPVSYYTFAYLSIPFIAVSALPCIILNVSRIKTVPVDIASCFVEFCLMLFIIARMLSVSKNKNTPGG